MNMDNPFEITSVARDDIVTVGFTEEQASSLTDMDMRAIASDMADDYLNQLFWQHLKYFVQQKLEQ